MTHTPSCRHRRRFLAAGAGALVAGLGGLARPALAAAGPAERTLAFDNLHTGERLRTAYWVQGQYVPDSLEEINHLLRDFRTDQIHAIDPRLLDTLHAITLRLGASRSIQVISGYRSPVTNHLLHERSSQVASHSLHMDGMAADIRIPGCELTQLRDVALSLGAGGVGFYPRSDFVHVDVGRVRRWSGT